LSEETKKNHRGLEEQYGEEWERIIGKARRKSYPGFFQNIDPRSENLEGRFCCSYALYLCMENFSRYYPAAHFYTQFKCANPGAA